jgi:RNA polymerase sigma factor (sigma-70 family)
LSKEIERVSESYKKMGGRGASLDDLRAVYERRLPELCRVAAAVVGCSDLAPDIVHEAFVRAVRQRHRFEGRGDLEGWVWQIVVNAARDARAKQRVEHELDELSDLEVPIDDPRRELVRSAVGQLPERQRLVLFLRYYADLDYRTIATAVAISEGTVAATLSAAHGRLRQLLSEVTP